MNRIAISLAATVLITAGICAARASEPVIEVSGARVPATSQTGGDVPLFMSIANHSNEPDILIRARCPSDIADFTGKYTVDRGEGAPALREIKTVTVTAGSTKTLSPDGEHLRLLHVRQKLEPGRTFGCSLVFQKAGTVAVEVTVVSDETKP